MADDDKPTIKPTRNGPFLVKNLKRFRNSKGENLKPPSPMMLCRCGHSKNKPFCDGRHRRVRFKDPKN
ncbi:MAG TPA: CDGSH iron-sulfur domain-containing protein [Acidobacteriota bacterium]|nr:CDGSH iron-sulfur domain-containing protein [Acidobacteriota bacterium]